MQNKMCFILTLAFVDLINAESSVLNLEAQEFDNIGAEDYDIEEEDLDDFSKFLDEANEPSEVAAANKDSLKPTIGVRKKLKNNKGLKSMYNIGDLKKFLLALGVHDQGSYDDNDIYALAEGVAAAAIGKGTNESRTYKKGKKTKGFHRVHHKDEYKKDKEFFEDDETKGNINKVGGKAIGFHLGAGAGFNKGNFHHDLQKGIYGKKGYSDKGFLNAIINGYSNSQELQ